MMVGRAVMVMMMSVTAAPMLFLPRGDGSRFVVGIVMVSVVAFASAFIMADGGRGHDDALPHARRFTFPSSCGQVQRDFSES